MRLAIRAARSRAGIKRRPGKSPRAAFGNPTTLSVVTIVSPPLFDFFLNCHYCLNVGFFYGRQFAFYDLHHVHQIFGSVNPITLVIGVRHANVSKFACKFIEFGSAMNQDKSRHA